AGTLARKGRVAQVLPGFDGRRLDDIVDYLNYVIVPAVFMVWAGSLLHWSFAALPILASAYGFSQENAKTEDSFFTGWPSYWNVVAFYCWLLPLSTTAGAEWIGVLSFAIFLPFKYIYPSRLASPLIRPSVNAGGLLWVTLVLISILAPDLADRLYLVEISLAYLVYYMVLSIWLGDWKSGWP
ncbi:MAG: CDP-diacylglycerol O-phosphatidyltransferase, partial [Planctomycetes bacterium]|nr:CDP-diacylglycerol O-phosphatidyltransferase [Planctomycetota bacterium]